MGFLNTRGTLAKLLATENLIVQHKLGARTASFNTEDRVLTLPVLETTDENVYNLMTAHEVGHALWTPPYWFDEVPNDIPFDFVNVIEDVRIEKMIQNKFPGLRSDFSRGYDALNQEDFFDIKDKDTSEMSLIDRINLHFKLGARALISFTNEEQTYVNMIDEADTYQKVCLSAKMLCDYLKAKRSEDETEEPLTNESQTTGSGPEQSSQSNANTSEDSDGDEKAGESAPESTDEMTSETQKSFDESVENMTDKYGSDYVYVKTPEFKLKEIVVTVDELRSNYGDVKKDVWSVQQLECDFKTFLSSIKSDVNFMVQQFEMKKSADAYSRQQIHKTGVLNTDVLHNYKLTDDVFIRQSTTPDGKNHGMVMMLDWSGSMCNISISTVKQIITLVQFCRKVQIPFEVYTFTSGSVSRRSDRPLSLKDRISVEGVVSIQVLSSTAKRNDIDIDLWHLWCEGHYSSRQNGHYPHSEFMTMGGTPLNNALFLVPEIITQFKVKTKTQKVSFVCVTDGESSPVYYYSDFKSVKGNNYISLSYSHWDKVMIRDGSYVFDIGNNHEQTGNIVKWIENKLEDVTITNIFIGSPKVCANYVKGFDIIPNDSQFRKENSATYTTKNKWPLIVCVSPKAFGEAQEEMDVEEGASKAKIKAALKKLLKSKQSSKVMLQTMVGQFA